MRSRTIIRTLALLIVLTHPPGIGAFETDQYNLPPVPLADILAGSFPQSPGSAVPLVTVCVGAVLLLLRAVDARTSLAFIGSTVVLMAAGRLVAPGAVPPLASLLVGDFAVAALLVLPDRRTAARTFGGRWATGAAAGIVAFIVRAFSSFPDGVLFAVLFANAFSAIIDEAALRLRARAAGVRP